MTEPTLGLSADEVLTTTRAVRRRIDFDRPVEREVLLECVDIALQAPTGSNRQGWHFVFVEDPAETGGTLELEAALLDDAFARLETTSTSTRVTLVAPDPIPD